MEGRLGVGRSRGEDATIKRADPNPNPNSNPNPNPNGRIPAARGLFPYSKDGHGEPEIRSSGLYR